MGQPKKRTSARKSGMRRSHLVLNLARRVNAVSPVKVRTTVRESGPKPAEPKENKSKMAKKTAKTF